VCDIEVNAGLCWRKPDGKGPLEEIGFDGRIIFKCIFKKQSVWIGLSCPGQGHLESSCEHTDEPTSSIKCREFHDY
jgi:hypothetical protein